MFQAVSQDPRAQQALPATPSYMGQGQTTAPVPPPTLTDQASSIVARLSSLEDQLAKMLSVIEPLPVDGNTGRAQRSGIVGALSDAGELLANIETIVQRIGSRL